MDTMRAALLSGPQKLTIMDMPIPTPSDDQILVRTLCASICAQGDLSVYDFSHRWVDELPVPHVLGHERSGEIVKIGKNVDGYQVGERIGWWITNTGAFGEYSLVTPKDVAIAKLSDNVTDEEGSFLEMAIAAMGGMWTINIRPGDRVAVLGLGAAGLILAQLAHIFGAGLVIGCDLFPLRLQTAEKLGMDKAYNVTGRQATEFARSVIQEFGEFDVVIDAMGNDLTDVGMDVGIEILKPYTGRYLMFSHPVKPRVFRPEHLSLYGITIIGCQVQLDLACRLAVQVERLVASGRLNLKDIITHRLPLSDLEKGLDLCRNHKDKSIKIVITF